LATALAAANKEPAQIEARLLLGAATGLPSVALLTDPGRALGKAATTLGGFAARRLAGEPVSRILGRSGFYGLDLQVSPAVLDPRNDTETLVNVALEHLQRTGAQNPRILDLGTGSGAILCALLDSRPDAIGLAVDLSPGACDLARRNLTQCGFAARSSVICGDWAEAVAGAFDLVVSNPPYIASREIDGLDVEVTKFDPMLALDGGADGLTPYRRIAPALPRLLRAGGAVCFEIGWRQALDVTRILAQAGFAGATTHPDGSGRDRVVSAQTGARS
jgi:release factor glutamine methyltransferase